MFAFEFDPIYRIFDGESVRALFADRFSGIKEVRLNLLLEGIQLFYHHPEQPVTSGELTSAQGITQRNLSAILRDWTHENVLRRTSYQPAIFRFQDPVPLDEKHLLEYNPLARQIADEFQPYREPLPYEIQIAYAWKTYPGLREEVILEAVRQTLEKDANAGIRSAEPMLPIVRRARTREEAIEALAGQVKIHAAAREILRRLGQDREPSTREVEMYTVWTLDWGFTQAGVLEACRAAAGGDPNFNYLNGILRNIRAESKPAELLDAEAVSESFRVNEEYAEICRECGSRATTANRDVYRLMRDQYDHDLIALAAKESGRAGAGFDGILKYLVKWERLGLASMEDIDDYLARTKEQYQLMAELFALWGLERTPSARDCRLARQWMNAGISREMIMTAADYAFGAEDPPLYMTKVLRRFQEKGIQNPRQAELDHQEYLREQREKREKENSDRAIERLRALGPAGPYAGQRSEGENPRQEEDDFLHMMLALEEQDKL